MLSCLIILFSVGDSVGFFLLKVNTIEIKSPSEKEVVAVLLRRDSQLHQAYHSPGTFQDHHSVCGYISVVV